MRGPYIPTDLREVQNFTHSAFREALSKNLRRRLQLITMEPPPTGLPQLSSYLPTSSSDIRSSSMTTTGINGSMGAKKRRNSIEDAFIPNSLTPHHRQDERLKRKQTPLEVSVDVEDKGSKAVSFSRLNSIYQAEEQVMSKGLSFSSTEPTQDGDITNIDTTSYFASQPATPRRERTSRYLSESDRREIITRIDGGEKQVALAREFCVSRAAICNLYKNRWEVLTRGSRSSESKHPRSNKRSRSRRPSPRLTSQPPATENSSAIPAPITVYPDVSTISIGTDGTPRDSKESSTEKFNIYRQMHEEEPQRDRSILSTATQADFVQGAHSEHYQASSNQRSPVEETVSSPVASRPFRVHEASAYSYPCRNLIAALRDESISAGMFQQRATRLLRLLIEEALTCLPHDHVQIKNRFGDVCYATTALDERDVCGISMEDKGMVLLRAFSTISPTSPTGVVSINPRTAEDKNSDEEGLATIHAQLPPVSPHQVVLLLDVQCATGNEACAVLYHLIHEKQIPAKSINFVTIISSFEGLQTVYRHFPDVTLITAQVDTVLDADQRIRPGIGDFTQRFWNVHFDASAF
ncbi:Uracil phosphoribosyltransferase [Phytophthora infestans]|uniref:Uracil phosphoribosyltransferase n=1 Tax=Phytophthora infestans TaxID=4787 RepID=A0A833T9H1_PHYIN|nr:Uracil phosphoribosyltransferase [Phytophthora infestans]